MLLFKLSIHLSWDNVGKITMSNKRPFTIRLRLQTLRGDSKLFPQKITDWNVNEEGDQYQLFGMIEWFD